MASERDTARDIYNDYVQSAEALQMGDIDPYQALEITPKATAKEIKVAYLKGVKVYHPDKGGDEQHFTLFKKAYACLNSPETRAYTDSFLKEKQQEAARAKLNTAKTPAYQAKQAPTSHARPASSTTAAPRSRSEALHQFVQDSAYLSPFKSYFGGGRSFLAKENGKPDIFFQEFERRLQSILTHLREVQNFYHLGEIENFEKAFYEYQNNFYNNQQGSGELFMKKVLNSLSEFYLDIPGKPIKEKRLHRFF